ncbi:NTP transferase domain-containing protein [bacterium]|nr:NTP transferase domain-containing protein [bacterium]
MPPNLREGSADHSCYSEATPSHQDSHYFPKQTGVRKALIIAAGNGRRLQGYQNARPKPLVKIAGLPLIKRVILSAKKAGVTEFVIVLGYQAARIRKSVNAAKLGVKVTWVRNSDWRSPNGISVLKAERFLKEPFFLFMSDHIFDSGILQKLQGLVINPDRGLLCVDSRLSKVPNLDDATKVWTENHRLIDIGKSLTDFNAIDAGIFVCTPGLFDALRRSQVEGDYSLSGGVRVLAQEGRMCSFNIGNSYWLDVDTIPEARQAERMLLRSTRSDNDGFIAKILNRRVSNAITKWLIKTPITPNQISVLNMCLSALLAWIVSFGKPLNTIIGGILFQLVSILDGCDGEVAKIKLRDSKSGAFVDTITDQISYVLFIIGVTVGAYNATNDQAVLYIAGVTIGLLLITLRFGLFYIRKKGSGSMRALDQDISKLNHERQKVWYLKFFGSVHHLGRRDVFSFAAFVLMLMGNITAFYYAVIASVNMMSIAIMISGVSMLSRGNRDQGGLVRSLKRRFRRRPVASEIDLLPDNEISD